MKGPKHTPGPWNSYARELSGEIVQLDIERKYARIASVNIRVDIPYTANACLIAAAPEMLEALELLHRLTLQTPQLANDPDCREVMDMAWAAIRKARGE